MTPGNVRRLLSETHCAYTGKEFPSQSAISFERVDNTIGYEPGNVIAVLSHVNQLKSNYDLPVLKRRARGEGRRSESKVSHNKSLTKNMNAKIKRRIAFIKEQEEHLARDRQTLEALHKHLEEMQVDILEDDRNQQIYAQIVSVLEENKPLGLKYMTRPQRLYLWFYTRYTKSDWLTVLSQFVTKTRRS